MSNSFQIDTLANLVKREVPASYRLSRVVFKQTQAQKERGIVADESRACFLPTLSESAASAFAAQYPSVVLGLIEDLQDKAVRKVWVTSKRSPTEADLTLEKLFEVWNETTTSERITKEQLNVMWKSKYQLSLVNTLARLRKIDLTISENVEMLTKVASNYQQYYLWIVSRKQCFWPTGLNADITNKIIAVLTAWAEDNQEDTIVLSVLDKVLDAQFMTVDVDAY